MVAQAKRRRFQGDSTWLIAQSLYTMALGLVMTGLAARLYGPSAFGLLAVAIAVAVVATPFATLGMDSVVLHALVKRKDSDALILGTSVALRLAAGGSLLSLMVLGMSVARDPSYDPRVIFALGLALMFKTGEAYLPWFQARAQIPRATVARMVAYTVTVLARIVVLSLGLSIAVYALTYALDAALVWAALCLTKHFQPVGVRERTKVSPRLGRQLLSRSWPLILSGLAVSLYNRVDQIMLAFMLPDKADVGRYAVSVTLAESWYFVPLAVVVARQAGVMRSHESSELQFREESQRLFDHAIRVSLLCAVSLGAAFPVVARLLYGSDYVTTDSIISALVLTAAGVLAVTGSARGPWLIALGLERYTLLYLTTGAGLNVLLNLCLIPRFGVVGAATATLAAQCVSVVLVPALIPVTRPSVVHMLRAVSLHR